MSQRNRREGRVGCLPWLIAFLAVVALALVCAIVLSNVRRAREDRQVVQEVGSGKYVDVSSMDTNANQLVLNAASYDRVSEAEAAAMVTPTPTPEPMATLGADAVNVANPNDPLGMSIPSAIGDGYLPVFRKSDSGEMKIAITVDECSGVTITKNIAKLAYVYGAKLTLFPTGDNVMRKGMGDTLRTCVQKLGFEIENRGYSTISKLYNMTDNLMCMEVWKQTIALDYVMNVRYQPHFYRLYGGNGENDLRTHGYLKQLGYYGIASYSHNGNAMSQEQLINSLAPGNVYLFKSNKKDANKMNALMKAARSAGYQMVTLNELFGLPDNEVTAAGDNILGEVMPVLGDYGNHFYFMKTGDCTWAVYQMQRRLVELGYLPPGTVDGVFGESSAQALRVFQAKVGLAATGAADPITQQHLFGPDAPEADVRATIEDLMKKNAEEGVAEVAGDAAS